MVQVKVRRPARNPPARRHPHVTVVSAAGSVTLGSTNQDTPVSGLGATWTAIDRPGTNALLRRAGRNRMTYKVSALLIDGISGKTIEQQILALDAICASKAVCGASLAEMANHKWQLTEVSATPSQRAEFTNAAENADVELTFVVAVDELQTVSASRKNTPPSNRKATASTVVVRVGDTLSKIAARVYGNANRWPELARKNGIRTPTSIKVGQRLKT